MENNNALVETLAENAKKYISSEYPNELTLKETDLFDAAIKHWIGISTSIAPTRPTRREIEQYLRDVIRDVVKNIVTKHSEESVVTLTFATQQLVNYLISNLGWQI